LARPAATAGSAAVRPNGGGQGKSKGGGGRQQLVSPWGQLAKGFPTRRRTKLSNSLILTRRNGRAPRGKK
jgi:large subunit ribosomal protein L2